MSGFIITGSSSGVGKTTVVTALLSLLEDVLPYKIGPDFIDPMFHEFVTKEKSINLDAFMYDEETIKYLFNFRNDPKKIKVVEGVMGLYSGKGHSLDNFSTAHVSRILGLPVILVVNGKKRDTTLAAEIKGLIEFDKRVNVKGIIINNVTEKSYLYLKEAIEMYNDVKCVGYLPHIKDIEFEERHLGLVQSSEIGNLDNKLNTLKETCRNTIDLEAIKEIANEYKDLEFKDIFEGKELLNKNIAIAKDEAFSFFYPVHEYMFEKLGCTIKYFSPLRDKEVPSADLVIFPGGYPENYLEELYSNQEMINDVRDKVKNNVKILAECGGFIYLTKGMFKEDKFYPLVGIYDITIQMKNSLDIKRFGYIDINYKGIRLKGHEFHYSTIKKCNESNSKYYIENKDYWCGYEINNTISGYPHIFYLSNFEFLKKILK